MLIPDYVVIKSNIRARYAVVTIGSFNTNQAAGTSDDWEIALNLGSEDIMALLGQIPKPPAENPDGSPFTFPQSPPHPKSQTREVRNYASGPQDL
jgi:hypothetical protein